MFLSLESRVSHWPVDRQPVFDFFGRHIAKLKAKGQ
jgi:hypothetical protein